METLRKSFAEQEVKTQSFYVIYFDKTRQDKTTLLHFFAHDTVMTDLAPQVAEANRDGL